MNTFANGLRCLLHPVTLFSIGLLLVNDHVLKVVAPSWLTGKLSDFAGLFVFPFVLAAASSVFTDRLQLSTRRVGGLAFAVAATWFVLIKTTAWGNTLTVEFLARVLGLPAQIVLDPTDLMALPVLIPAWRLWNRSQQPPPTRWGWVALGAASLAIVATTPAAPLPVVTRVASQNGAVYALAVGYSPVVFKSEDGGRTFATDGVFPEQTDGRHLPIVVCDSPPTHICYRISGNEQVDQSDDGGRSWRVAWNIPAGRRDYIEHQIQRQCGLGCARQLDMGPYDLTLAEPTGQNGLHTLIVAMGNQGVLVRTPQGLWERHPVGEAQPTPFAAEKLAQAFGAIGDETLFWVVLAIAFFLISCVRGWWVVLRQLNSRSDSRVSVARTMLPFFFSTALVVILALLPLAFPNPFGLPPAAAVVYSVWSYHLPVELVLSFNPPVIVMSLVISVLLSRVGSSLLLLGIILTWWNVGRVAKEPRMVWKAVVWCPIALFGIFPLAWLPILIWAFDVIPFYSLAVLLSLMATGLVFFVAWRGVGQAGQQATAPGVSEA